MHFLVHQIFAFTLTKQYILLNYGGPLANAIKEYILGLCTFNMAKKEEKNGRGTFLGTARADGGYLNFFLSRTLFSSLISGSFVDRHKRPATVKHFHCPLILRRYTRYWFTSTI